MKKKKSLLRLSGRHYQELKNHLFPGDGNEAIAIALCGRHENQNENILLVHELVLIPYNHCSIRTPDLLNWSTEIIVPHLEKAAKKGLAILKIHSHPNGYSNFSKTDDISDKELFQSVFGWMDDNNPHASAIMLPDGRIFGRLFFDDLSCVSFNRISVSGDDLLIWNYGEIDSSPKDFAIRTVQAFGEGTIDKLSKLKVVVVGCSGTGSPLIEQLVRLGVGELLLIDPDKVEVKNLNRIVNSTMSDAIEGKFKVDVLKHAIEKIGLGTKVTTYSQNLFEENVIKKVISSDVIFGCVDSVDGRHLMNQISTFYLLPYFDLGVKLKSDGNGGIDQIMGSINYVQPGGSSLRTRGVYTDEELRAASMIRTNPAEYERQKKSGYIVDVAVDSPAVVSINTFISSMAVNEFLNRIHSYRYDPSSDYAITRMSFTDFYIQNDVDGDPDVYLQKFVGRGDLKPFLNMPEFN